MRMENDFLDNIRKEERYPERKSRGFTKFLKRTGLFFSIIIAVLIMATWVSGVVFGTSPDAEEGWYRGENHSGFFGTLRTLILQDDKRIDGLSADRINILLMGMGGAGHDGAYLTDTIVLASIKPSTDEISMISIPRDLAVPIPGHGWRKVNHANAFGEIDDPGNGAEFARQVIEQITQQPIHYYVRMDFAGFEQLINQVGGIDVVVDRTFTDSQYPTHDYRWQRVTFEAGPQHMDGETALIYARSRHGNNGEGSDFARARRQQKVVVAFKNKMLSLSTLLNPKKLNDLKKVLERNITSDVEISTSLALAQIAKDLDTDNIRSLVLSDAPGGLLTNGSGENLYMLLPRDRTFREIQIAIDTIFENQDVVGGSNLSNSQITLTEADKQRTAIIEAPEDVAAIEVQNGTWVVGLAAKVKAELEREGHVVPSVANAENRPYSHTVIYDFSDGVFTENAQTIAQQLGFPATAATLDIVPTPPADGTDILIILGKDYTGEDGTESATSTDSTPEIE